MYRTSCYFLKMFATLLKQNARISIKKLPLHYIFQRLIYVQPIRVKVKVIVTRPEVSTRAPVSVDTRVFIVKLVRSIRS